MASFLDAYKTVVHHIPIHQVSRAAVYPFNPPNAHHPYPSKRQSQKHIPSTTTSASSSAAGGFGEDAKIKKAAGKRSGVNSFSRESEQQAKINQSERRREERKARGAEKRIGVVGGLLGRGSFE